MKVKETSDETKSSNRALRSQAAVLQGEMAEFAPRVALKENLNDSKRRKLQAGANPSSSLTKALPDNSIRSDFLEIVRDMRAQALAFERSNPKVRHLSLINAV